ncbi:type II secretion system F family protein [Candidatus Pacearchaeota archaeon]|nr:MAG: type II secretion system F family protein [Candidatus Pacearchaeota archaeon]
MEFKIPYSVAPLDKLKKRSVFFSKLFRPKKNSSLARYLESCDVKLTREQYLGICLRGFVNSFLVIFALAFLLFAFLRNPNALAFSLGLAFIFSSFIFMSRLAYPRVYHMRKQRDIERNLVPALQDMLVQLNSGIPLFDIMINIANSDYGALSEEFKKAVKKIHAGYAQIDVLDEIADKNPSIYFRRVLWQISNGMRAGSDISIIVKEGIRTLNDEQIIQIQTYGSKLNPLIMFYMIISVILPALSVAFLTILSSMTGLPARTTYFLFVGVFIFVTFLQIMFLGLIKSSRPSLL